MGAYADLQGTTHVKSPVNPMTKREKVLCQSLVFLTIFTVAGFAACGYYMYDLHDRIDMKYDYLKNISGGNIINLVNDVEGLKSTEKQLSGSINKLNPLLGQVSTLQNQMSSITDAVNGNLTLIATNFSDLNSNVTSLNQGQVGVNASIAAANKFALLINTTLSSLNMTVIANNQSTLSINDTLAGLINDNHGQIVSLFASQKNIQGKQDEQGTTITGLQTIQTQLAKRIDNCAACNKTFGKMKTIF
eukprot:m.341232 g.341232  ORF g.341232 m.341232 type:complete len:247 (+) comp19924_c0_seq1:60-800(+)